MKASIVLCVCLTLCPTLYAQSSPTPPTSARSVGPGKTKTKSPPPAHAQWTESTQSFVGITHEQFSEAGLAKLTTDEFVNLLTAIYAVRQEAVDKAQKLQAAYSCGPVPPNYDKVRLYVDVSEKTPSEVASGVRQRLRGLADVEIVYTPIEADVGIGIVGFENELEGGRKTGYSASVVTYDPCKGSLGDHDWPVRMLNNHFLSTAANASQLVDSLVSSIDTNDLESARKLHSAIKKTVTAK